MLAERLGMSVEAMRDTLSNREYLMWLGFYRWRAAELKRRQ